MRRDLQREPLERASTVLHPCAAQAETYHVDARDSGSGDGDESDGSTDEFGEQIRLTESARAHDEVNTLVSTHHFERFLAASPQISSALVYEAPRADDAPTPAAAASDAVASDAKDTSKPSKMLGGDLGKVYTKFLANAKSNGLKGAVELKRVFER